MTNQNRTHVLTRYASLCLNPVRCCVNCVIFSLVNLTSHKLHAYIRGTVGSSSWYSVRCSKPETLNRERERERERGREREGGREGGRDRETERERETETERERDRERDRDRQRERHRQIGSCQDR